MTQLNWRPGGWADPLDYLDYKTPAPLVTPDGTEVKISQQFPGFIVHIGDKHFETADNVTACYVLNTHEVGIKE